MATKKEKEILRQAAEDGDSLASRVYRDVAEEDGLPSMSVAERGDWVVIFTGMYFYCGQLLGEDHEQFVLAPGAELVYQTGELKKFFGKGLCDHCETLPTVTQVRKGPTAHVSLWTHNKPCRKADGSA